MAKFTITYTRRFEFAVEAPSIDAASKFAEEYKKQYGDNVTLLSILAEGRTVGDTSVTATAGAA